MKDSTLMEQKQPRASVPAFGGWDDMAAAAGGGGAVPDYSLDFSKIRSARVQQRRKAMSWSSGAGPAAGEERQSSTAAGGGGGSEDRELQRRRRHRRQHSDAAEARQPIRAPPKEGRSNKLKGYLFGCMGRLYVGQH